MNFDELWEELRAENPEVINRADQRVAEILSREKQRGCPPDCNPGFCDDPDEEICDRCWASWEKRKLPITNADRIRRMSDEELAAWIDGSFKCADWCDTSKFPNGDCMEVPCLGCIIEWLKQEVKL